VGGTGKSVTLVLCTPVGRPLGALPAFAVDTPWWQEVAEVVERARELHGVDVTILRLIGAPEQERSGGAVVYLAEVEQAPSACLTPASEDVLKEHPLRQSYARPGGPQQDLDWAVEVLARRGQSLIGAPVQIKTWNLSSIWRLPSSGGDVWLKVVPSFFAHEAVIMSYLDAACVPRLLGAEPGRVVMAHIDGVDHFSTTGSALLEMMELLIGLQMSCLDKVSELLSLGLPDRRLESIVPRFAGVVEDQRSSLSVTELHQLERLLETLDGRAAAIEACGVPYTLVHGDFHPGNVRGPVGRYVILDWGDSAVGHPLTDELAFFRPLSIPDRNLVAPAWSAAWRRAIPGCDPERPQILLRPLMPLVAALVYSDFCAAIEPDELVYHARDVPSALRDAASLA
jgi:hypothetical protein